MTELERIILELDLKVYKELLDFYNYRCEIERENEEIREAIDMILDIKYKFENE